jgi:hypothetical protein
MPEPGADDLPPVVRPQRQQRRFAQWPLAVVLGCMLGSLLVVTGGRFRVGTLLLAGALLLGAVLRATLPERSAGLLAVRVRWLDVLTLGSLGAAVLLLALIVPNPR